MKSLAERYNEARCDYQQNWAALNEPLYDLCRRYPDHRHRDGIHAKLWVIGRTYATGIERMIPKGDGQGSSLRKLAGHLWNRRDEVDESVDMLNGLREPLTLQKLTAILSAHGKLHDLVQRVSRNHRSPRSFVSKYLHFHCPAVPIYDSVARSSLDKLCPWTGRLITFDAPEGTDEEYSRFVFRFWRLYQYMKGNGVDVSVKLLDEFLLRLRPKTAQRFARHLAQP